MPVEINSETVSKEDLLRAHQQAIAEMFSKETMEKMSKSIHLTKHKNMDEMLDAIEEQMFALMAAALLVSQQQKENLNIDNSFGKIAPLVRDMSVAERILVMVGVFAAINIDRSIAKKVMEDVEKKNSYVG